MLESRPGSPDTGSQPGIGPHPAHPRAAPRGTGAPTGAPSSSQVFSVSVQKPNSGGTVAPPPLALSICVTSSRHRPERYSSVPVCGRRSGQCGAPVCGASKINFFTSCAPAVPLRFPRTAGMTLRLEIEGGETGTHLLDLRACPFSSVDEVQFLLQVCPREIILVGSHAALGF